MPRHIGGIIGVAAALAFVPLNCRPRRPPPVPRTPPTAPASPPTVIVRPVRILLAGDAADARIAIDGAYEVRRRQTDETLDRGAFLPTRIVRVTPTGFLIGNRAYVGSVLDLLPAAGVLVEVNGRRYRGALRLVQRPGSLFHVINVVPIEPYLASVINGEMPSRWPAAALRAQAVAARTYALYQIQQRAPAALYDLRPDQWSQMYLGLQSETARSRRLVNETAGIVLTYRGRLFCTYYSSTCGGHTQDGRHVFEDGAIPPLAGVTCPYCTGSKYSHWERTISTGALSTAINARLAGDGRTVGTVTALQVLQRAASGHVARIKVLGTTGAVEMGGKAFRHAVGTRRLPSTRFQVHTAAGALRFVGGGFGHGVGMCQVGAKGAAEAGLDFLQILQYYYPHSKAVRVTAAAGRSGSGSGRRAAGRDRPVPTAAGRGGQPPTTRQPGDDQCT